MRDPYSVLNVSRSSSDEEIKQAYRALAKKYHPDNYNGSPLADLAGEKMSEINAAYDAIQADRKLGYLGRNFDNGHNNQYNSADYTSSTSKFQDVRRLLSSRRILEAEEILNGTPLLLRDAEWHFLKGTALYNRGFLDNALEYFQAAVQMDPNNVEYRVMLNSAVAQRQNAYGSSPDYQSCAFCSPCNLCTAIVCADCTCSACRCCCGG